MTHLKAVSPVDGRYAKQTRPLQEFFSEQALIHYRIRVEVLYFIALCKIPLPSLAGVEAPALSALEQWANNLTDADIERVKAIEATTNHDVKAVEYLLRERFDALNLSEYKEFIHFGLTSQDINNTAMPMMLHDAIEKLIVPKFDSITLLLAQKAAEWREISMLARTHGQPASPTRLGKEIMVFVERLHNQLEMMGQIPHSGKFGGATGNFNAHQVAYPEVNWVDFANRFLCDTLGLQRQQITTQIEHYDYQAAFFDNLKRINTILIDFCRDIWTYISMDYFKQQIKDGEVGSSAMPHKVNPIDFENAEGNLGFANAMLSHFSEKLPISRLQRDLTDSTVTRNIGMPLAHILIALNSLEKGIGKLLVNTSAIEADLAKNLAVVAEAIQTILRRENYPDPYNALKLLTRTHTALTPDGLREFIVQLDVDERVKTELLQISPSNYTGIDLF